MENLQPGQQIGPYRVIAQIGQGGMASVFKAYQASMDRYVALKVLPREFAHSAEFRARFQQEARLIANLEHASILPIYDFGENDGIHYFVMRLLEAGTLKERIRAKPLSLNEIDELFTQIAGALGYAHKSGIIHRDIKPSNILVDPHGDAFLTDFGIAKIIEGSSSLTGTGTVTGTPDYMSPEQGRGERLDQRSDIYSLGVVLYEMVTGQVPFEAETPLAVILKHMSAPLPPPSQLKPGLAPDLERVILKSLSKEREERFASCEEFVTSWKAAVKAAETYTAPAPIPSQPTITTPIPVSPPSFSPPPPTFTSTYPQTPISPPSAATNWMPIIILGVIGICLCGAIVAGSLSIPVIMQAMLGPQVGTVDPTFLTALAQSPEFQTLQAPEPFPTVQPIDTVDVEFPTAELIPTSPPLETPTPENALATTLWSVGSEGTEPGQFNDARYMAVDGAGNVYIGEHQQGSRIQIFDSSGSFVAEWKIENDAYLTSLAAKNDGTLYALMTRDIYVYEGTTGQLLDTYSLNESIDAITVSGNDELYAVTNSNIIRFDESGQPTIIVNDFRSMFSEALGPGTMTVDDEGNIYVAGPGVGNILKFSADGSALTRIGEAGSGPDQLQTAPEAITVDGQSRIYASNFNGIQVYDTDGNYIGNIPAEGLVFSLLATFNEDTIELFALDRNSAKLTKYEIVQ